MLFALESYIRDGHAFLAQRFHHGLGLIRRHDFVFQTLKKNDWTGQFVREVYRRTLNVEIATLRIRTDQIVKIARLKLVGFFRQGFSIADTKVTCSGLELIPKSQRAQRGVTTRAGTVDHQPVAVGVATSGQKSLPAYTILTDRNAPASLHPLT